MSHRLMYSAGINETQRGLLRQRLECIIEAALNCYPDLHYYQVGIAVVAGCHVMAGIS